MSLGLVFGVGLGLWAAGKRGWCEEILMRMNDLTLAFPIVLLAILITAGWGPGISNAIIALGIYNIPIFARLSRGAALTIWSRDYIMAARAAGIGMLDGVHLDLNDDEGFEHACRQGAEWGFDGKTLIHPKTIDAANKAFAPSLEEVVWSKKIITAHAEAAQDGKGIVVVDGKLIENLHVLNAERLVTMAQAIEEMENA